MPSAQLPRVGSPPSESMLIPFLQVEARLLALLAPSILCKEFWLDTDIHPGGSPPHISSLCRSAGIHECDSGPALRAKHLPVLLSRRFEVIGLFFSAVDFFLRILLPLQLYGFGNRSLNLCIQPFRKHRKRKRIQESRTDLVYRVLRIFPAGDDIFRRPIQFVSWEADLASRPRCGSVLCRDGLYHVLGS